MTKPKRPKHTPAPWEVKRVYDGEYRYAPRIHVGPATINFSQGYQSPAEDRQSKARAEADAALIKAALPMLAALDLLNDSGVLAARASDSVRVASARRHALEAITTARGKL